MQAEMQETEVVYSGGCGVGNANLTEEKRYLRYRKEIGVIGNLDREKSRLTEQSNKQEE